MTDDAPQTAAIFGLISFFFHSHESDDGMRITAEGPRCAGGYEKLQERETFSATWQELQTMSGNN